MYLKALGLYGRTSIDDAVRVLTGIDTPERRIGKFLQSAIDAVAVENDRRGCFLCNASIDQAAVDPETQRSVNGSLERLGRVREGAFGVERDRQQPASRRRPTSLVSLFRTARVSQGRSAC
jgi:hypothetical protein